MIRVRGVDHVAINCKDLAKSLEFYTGVLGLQVSPRENQKPGIEIFLDCGTSLIGLIQSKAPEPVHAFQEPGVGANHIGFRIDAASFDAVMAEMNRRGIPIRLFKKREKSWSMYVNDPDGNNLEMTAWPAEDA